MNLLGGLKGLKQKGDLGPLLIVRCFMKEDNLNGIRVMAAALLLIKFLGELLGKAFFADTVTNFLDSYFVVMIVAYLTIIVCSKKIYKTNLRYVATSIYLIAIVSTAPQIYLSFIKDYGPYYGSIVFKTFEIIMLVLLIREALFGLHGNRNT